MVAICVEAPNGRRILDHDERPAVIALLDVAKEAHKIGDIEATRI